MYQQNQVHPKFFHEAKKNVLIPDAFEKMLQLFLWEQAEK